MSYHQITLLFLLAAVGLYAFGLMLPAFGLFVIGMLAESVFWIRLVVGWRRNDKA